MDWYPLWQFSHATLPVGILLESRIYVAGVVMKFEEPLSISLLYRQNKYKPSTTGVSSVNGFSSYAVVANVSMQ